MTQLKTSRQVHSQAHLFVQTVQIVMTYEQTNMRLLLIICESTTLFIFFIVYKLYIDQYDSTMWNPHA